jgi:DNA-binding PadR family transcriptional regulator
MRGEMLSGHLEFMLLAIVADTPAHGYAVIQALREKSEGVFDLPEGTIYPALHRLHAEGLLSGRWVTADGRRRRIYSLTAKGGKTLDSQREQWETFAQAVSAVTGAD